MRLALFFVLFIANISYSATVNVRLVIRPGTLSLTGTSVAYEVFTENNVFQQNSDLLVWNQYDDINLTVVNQGNSDHSFTLEGHLTLGSIAVGDSLSQSFTLNQLGVFRYYDPQNAPYNAYMGLSGTVHVKDAADMIPYFYWDLREHQESWNSTISSGGTPNQSTYSPEHFTINGNYSPNINNDPIARVNGNVGNEFRIIIVNHGRSIHPLHFHGYHLSIESDSKNSNAIGRSKDSFPVFPEEHLILSCTPDKPGEYPVHDHNLVAVTGNSVYGAGMFLTMLIIP